MTKTTKSFEPGGRIDKSSKRQLFDDKKNFWGRLPNDVRIYFSKITLNESEFYKTSYDNVL